MDISEKEKFEEAIRKGEREADALAAATILGLVGMCAIAIIAYLNFY